MVPKAIVELEYFIFVKETDKKIQKIRIITFQIVYRTDMI